MTTNTTPTIDELIAEARELADVSWYVEQDVFRPLLVQLADALEESQRGYHHKDALAASWREKCEKARAGCQHDWWNMCRTWEECRKCGARQ